MATFRFVIILILIGIPRIAASQEVSLEKLKSQRTRQLCIHYLDGYLSLTQEQHIALEELLERDWTKNMNTRSRILLWAGYNSGLQVFQLLKPSDLEAILSEDQVLQFESLGEHGLNQSEQLDYLQGLVDAPVDPIKASLDRAVILELQRIEKLLDLNEEQVRILRIAAKGTATKILAERRKLREQLAEGNQRILRGLKWVKVAVEGPTFRIREVGTWNQTLKKVLTEQQYSILLVDQAAQSYSSSKVSSHSITMSYFHNHKISLDEYRNFTKLIENGIADAQKAGQANRHGSMAFDAVDVLADLDDERIKESISAESWNAIKPTLDRIRSMRDDDLQEGR